jgi:hypothetical protein
MSSMALTVMFIAAAKAVRANLTTRSILGSHGIVISKRISDISFFSPVIQFTPLKRASA